MPILPSTAADPSEIYPPPGPPAFLAGYACHTCLRYYQAETWHRLWRGHWPFPFDYWAADAEQKLEEYALLREAETVIDGIGPVGIVRRLLP